jgi:hypothetical protein
VSEALKRGLNGKTPKAAIALTAGIYGDPKLFDVNFVEGLQKAIPGLQLTGGSLSGEFDLTNQKRSRAWMDGGEVHEARPLVIALGPEVRTGAAFANGMTPLETSAVVTEVSNGLEWKSVDGKPAKDRLLDLLVADGDDKDREAAARSPVMYGMERFKTLAVKDAESGMYLMHIPTIHPDGKVMDAWPLSSGTQVEVVKIDKDACANAVRTTGKALQQSKQGSPDIVLSFSCALRGFTLGGESANEDAILREYVQPKNQLGIIAAGEVGSPKQGGKATLSGWCYSVVAAQ